MFLAGWGVTVRSDTCGGHLLQYGRELDGQRDGRVAAQDGIAHGFDTAEGSFFVLGVVGRRHVRGGRFRGIRHFDVPAFLVCVGELVAGRALSVAGWGLARRRKSSNLRFDRSGGVVSS